MRRLAPLLAGVCLASSAGAGELAFSLSKPAGKPAPDAVVVRQVVAPSTGAVRVAVTGDLRARRLRHGGY
ncbi:hypothetical protein [Phenylobacterium sp.]|jgi:hypothetical protein|uniref:hypothetical protein n=1 Tax=Phenylobacterium sp. TaxID=1871053 RepID=UPI002F91D8C3